MHYDLLTCPALSNPTYTKPSGLLAFNAQHGGNIEYVINRRHSLGLFMRGFRTRFYTGYGSSSNDEERYRKLFGTVTGMNYRIYSHYPGNIAPQGRFTDLGMSYTKAVVGDRKVPVEQLSSCNLHLGLGKQMVYGGNFMLQYGIEVAYPLLFLENSSYATIDASKRYANLMYVNFRVGFGWLTF
ncbi:hypothetical protein [Catalinimonas alkaloidigena]|uniref:hypothetical protein n=1 Tax=Catalinimonas alkaloidigena TaxID=1075417 RepID=UPI001C409B54|nr:hypothetical protein [Catalinimonas alkaloidigena]